MRASLAAGFRWALGKNSVNEKPKRSSMTASVKVKDVKDPKDAGGAEDLLEQAWCQQCQRHDFGRFCPVCGQCLVHEVVTPTGHWRLGSTDRSLVKVKQENERSPALVTRAAPPRNSPQAEPATPLSSPCSDGSVSDLPLKEEPYSTPREKQASQRYSDDESTGLEQGEAAQSPEELTPSEETPEESVPKKTEQKCPPLPQARRGMLSMLRPEQAVEDTSRPEMPKASKECKEPCSPRPKGRFLAFVAKRRHTQRGTPLRSLRRTSDVAAGRPCTALVPMSPPLRLGKVLRMPKKRLRRKQKAEMTEVPAMQLSEFMGECPCEVFQVFRNFEAGNGMEPTGALARLKAAREVHGAEALQEALQCCAEAILCCGDCRSSFVLVDSCIDLLGTAAHEVENTPGQLLSWLVQRLGGEAKALRDRPARQRAASLLWRLLPEKEHQVSRLILDAATMTLLDLAKDKTPAIRLAATRGLSKIPGAETKAALLQLTRDPTPAVRGAAVVSLGDCGARGAPGALWEASARCLDAILRVRLRFYEAAEKQDVDDLPQDVLRCGLSDGNAEVRAACLSMIKVWAARKEPDDALRRLVAAAGSDAERALRALLVLPEWATYRDKMAARTPTDAASALIWRISTQLAPELPTEAKPLGQQAIEALLGEDYDVLREMLRLVLEVGEGPTEELAELAMTVLRHCPASCGPVGTGSFNVFAMAMALLRRLKPKEELQLFLTQLLDDFRYSCQAQAKKKSESLKEKTMKALYVIEAAFSALGKELEDFDLGCNLLDDWLRPAMDQDGEERALALRCLALYSSSSCEEAVKHWTFFLELMKSDRKDEAMTKTCGLFLLDVMLLYGDQLPPGAALSAFAALRQVLGRPLQGGPSEVQRCLAERLITILLYGQWDAETELDASWFLAWLMLEAFRHPASTTPDLKNQAEVNMEAAMQAAFRGRLLCMFGCLGRASLPHATRLSSAMQLLLSTDLWRLGTQISEGSGPRGVQQWRAVHLPRLLRLVCQQLAASCVQQKSSNAQHWAQLWLERIWRPLALLCLEVPEEEQLTELLSATAFALQPSGASNLAPLQKAKNWQSIKREVEESCQEIVAHAERCEVEAGFLPMLRDLTRRLEEMQEEDISDSWQARVEAQRQRSVLQEQLELRRICTEVQHQNRQIGGKRQMPSDDDSAGHGPKYKKKRVARSLFVGPPGH